MRGQNLLPGQCYAYAIGINEINKELWSSVQSEKSEERGVKKLNGYLSMKTEAMSSNHQAETEKNMQLPEPPKRWKTRLERFQSSLRRSMRIKKGYSPRSGSFVDGEQRVELASDNQNFLAKRSSKHVRREIMADDQHNGVSTKQLNGTKTASHSHYLKEKTSLDSYGFDKRKSERNKTFANGNNNCQNEKKNSAGSSSSPAHVSDLAVCGQDKSSSQKKSQRTKRQRANTNTERTPLSKSKSLSILTNLFKRSSHSKHKNNRGKSSSFGTAQTSLSKGLSTATSADFDNLATDIVVSSSSIDSCCDNEPRFKGSKYYSLKRSKKKLVFPNNNITRSFSLDYSLDPCTDPLMEKSRTFAAIPPCIRVEEYRENSGGFERSLTAEFNLGSSGSVTIDTGPEYYQNVTGCSPSCKEGVRDSLSRGTRKNGGEHETGVNITHDAARSSDAWKRHSAPPISSFSTDKNSSNIGSPILRELKTDIATGEESRNHFEHSSDAEHSNSLEERNFSSENVQCTECLKSEMGNNLSYTMQKKRKFNSKDAKLKLAILRSIKKNGKTFHEKSLDGEEDPIIEQTDFLESFEREVENGGLNYFPKDVSANNELTKDKSNSLYEGSEALGMSEKMIDIFHGNNYARDFSDVKTTVDDITGENQGKENRTVDEKCTCENTERLSNGKVNIDEEVDEENFCSSNFGQTEDNGSSQQGVCLSCRKTRSKLTDSESIRCSPVIPEPASRKINPGVLNEQNLRDHISEELITDGLPEICNGGQRLAKNLKVNSLPSSARGLSLPSAVMHSSFPDIRKLHALHLSPKLSDSSGSLSSSGLHMENEFNNNTSFEDSRNKIYPSLRNGFTNCKKHGRIMNSHLSPESPEERQRSCSARIPSRSPVQQVLQTESRSVSCSQLDKNGNDSPTCTSPPYVRPRIQSLEELPPCTAEVILRKKRSIIRKTRMKHTASLPFVDNVFNDIIDNGKRHSYGGHDDITFLQLPHLLQRSQSAEGQLDSCNSSMQSLNSSSSITENELGSTFSVGSELSSPGAFDKNLGRSRSVPGFLGADFPHTSPIPEERSSVSEMEGTCKSAENSDDDDDDYDEDDDDIDGEMDVPEAFAEALWDHVTMDPEELSFQAGDIITVLTMTSCDWWFGQVGDRVGWFPAPFVRVRVSQTLAADETLLAPPVRTRKGTNEGFLSDAVVRSRVVLEILSTERDYVKNLEDVVEGYLKQARKRTDMFTEEQIAKIFSNIEQIYLFHQEILRQLEECFVEEDPCASEIGSVFLNNKKGFDIYSEYCNNHPHAMAELKTLCESNKYKQFFEACRLLQDMISISLDGFLLTPVQKICKYPLQLAELKKHTRANHKDFQTVKQALEAMKNVASLINERKRKVESINKIAKWQSTIEGWEGEDVLERSSELIHSGDVVKTSNGSLQDRVMFLFDHQLVYCKKDILKKNGLTYKGRIDMDDCTVIWLRDGEENLDRSPLHNAWKIYNFKKEKWYILYTKKAADKEKWMKAFRDERRRVKEDAKTGLIISQNTRKAAMRAAKASVKHKKVNGKKEKPFQKSQSTTEIKPPPSPTLRLPDPVSSADFKEEDEDRDTFGRSSVIRRSFGLRGSKKGKDKEKRMSSIF